MFLRIEWGDQEPLTLAFEGNRYNTSCIKGIVAGGFALQRFAVRLNHNIVCHTSLGAGGLLGKKHASTV